MKKYVEKKCPACNGTGIQTFGRVYLDCDRCEGTGVIQVLSEESIDELQKTIDYANMEFAAPNQQFMLFRNSEEAIQALMNNEIPGIEWTEEDQRKLDEEKKGR